MTLDISTLVLLTIAVAFGLGLLSIVFFYLQAGTRGMRDWGIGLIGVGLGYVLIYLYPRVAGPFTLFAGWACVLLAVLVLYQALDRICGGTQTRFAFGSAAMGLAVLGWLYFSYVDPSALGRTNVTSVALGAIAVRAAWRVWLFARRTRYNAPAVAVAALLLMVAITPVIEIWLRKAESGDLGLPIEYGLPPVVFARVLGITALTMSVMWLEISRLYTALEDVAMHDELTGISNRRAIVAEVQRELSRSHREGISCSVAIFDVDFFKNVNDAHGHLVGDVALKWVTEVIGRTVRTYDKLGRYGGEEFLLVMPNALEKEAVVVAERARSAIQNETCIVDGKEIHLTVSAGVAVSNGGTDLEALLLAADNALYAAKEKGRNRVVVGSAPVPAVSLAASRGG